MTRIRITNLFWDEWNKEHIKKHNIFQEEVEIAVTHAAAHRKGKKGRFILIGRAGKRMIAMIMRKEKTGAYYVVTARDADKKERRLVYENEKQK